MLTFTLGLGKLDKTYGFYAKNIATKLVADQFNILVFSIICIQYNIKKLFLFVRSANITFLY